MVGVAVVVVEMFELLWRRGGTGNMLSKKGRDPAEAETPTERRVE